MRYSGWRRAALLTAMCSTLALNACVSGGWPLIADDPVLGNADPVMASVPKDPSVSPDQQPALTTERLTRLGDAAMAAGDPGTAIGFYRRAVDLDHDNYPILIHLGLALMRVGAFAEAADVYREALAFAPRDPEALRGLGNALLAQNDPLLAREQYQIALEASEDPTLYGAIGVTMDMTGDHGLAQGYYRKGLETVPDHAGMLTNLALSLALSDEFGEAIEIMRHVVTRPDATIRHRQNLALIYGLAGRPDEARRVASMDLDPRTVEANLAFYDALRPLPDKAKYLIGPNRGRIAAKPERAPSPMPAPATSSVDDGNGSKSSAAAPALPAPAIDGKTFEKAETPAALPPVGPQQIDDQVRSWTPPVVDDGAEPASVDADSIASALDRV